MTQREGSAPPLSQLLAHTIRRYQETYAALETTTDLVPQAELRGKLRAIVEEFYELIEEEVLLKVARRWQRSAMVGELVGSRQSFNSREDFLRSIAVSIFLDLIEALPTLSSVDARRNPPALLRAIAKRRMIDRQRQFIRQTRAPHARGSAPTTSGMSAQDEARVWIVAITAAHDEIVDPQADTPFTDLIEEEHRQRCLEEVQLFSEQKLSREDRTILQLRHRTPPTSFAAIAEVLGKEETEDNVRKRYHRSLSKIRAHLRTKGLLED